MSELSEGVHINESFDVDKVVIERVLDKDLYVIYLPLDSTPDSVWIDCFKIEKKGINVSRGLCKLRVIS